MNVFRKWLRCYTKKPFPVRLELKKDTLVISSIDQTSPTLEKIRLEGFDFNGQFLTKSVSLPHREKVNYFAARYKVTYQEGSAFLHLDEKADSLQIMANRTSDSLFIVTENPRKIAFRYFLFKNQKLIAKAQTQSVQLKRSANANDSYTLSVQFVWAGEAETQAYEIGFDKKDLAIHVDHPPLIYPGEKAQFTATVTDAFGKPVKNADLTAYAITKKFQALHVASVPDLAKTKRRRTIINEFKGEETDLTLTKRLDFNYWRKNLGLDSITFYKFLFPDSGYFEYRTASPGPQFAPFAVGFGDVHPVQVIYVDGQPVYYNGVGTLEPYSFAVKPGYHKIELRLRNALVTLHKIRIDSLQKLIFSVNRYRLPGDCSIIEMPTHFTEQELTKLSRYFVTVRSNTGSTNAFIRQGDRYHVFGRKNNYYGSRELVGPLYPGRATYFQKDGFDLTFDYHPFFNYEFRENILTLREAKVADYLKSNFGWHQAEAPSFSDQVQTAARISDYWKSLEEKTSHTFKRFPDSVPASKKVGKLILEGQPAEANELFVKATFIVNLDDPDEYYVFPNWIRNILFSASHYQAVLIFNNEDYLKADSILVRPHGVNYYDLKDHELHSRDSFSVQVLRLINKWSVPENYLHRERELELQKVRTLYYEQASSNYSFGHSVSGRIVDEDGSGIPGVNVVVKGSALGTATDIEGYYTIHCPENATLVFSFIGYATEEEPVKSQGMLNVKLQADMQQLQLSEVVVVGFGLQRNSKYLTGSVSTMLSGRVAGVSINRYQPGVADSVTIKIRGLSAIQSGAEPLVVLDGRIVRLSDVDKNQITAIEVVSGSAASLYGSQAANGLILISTRPGATKEYLKQMGKSIMPVTMLEEVPGNSLRRNFRDYAFWEPQLKTDENGKAVFEATFPDDITGWNTYVLGMASKRRTGQTTSTIQSYKPVMAQLAQPHFLIEGDQATAIGKITNYGIEKIQLDRSIKINDREISKASVDVENSRIDSILVKASGADSIAVQYTVSYKNYADGELRKMPVYRRGVKEVKGTFVSLERDTSLTLNFNKQDGAVTLYAQADLVDVLLDEIAYLKNYPFECNEQLASGLKALLLEKQIQKYKGEKFKSEGDIEKALKKLISYQNSDGSWSWWKTGEGDTWITLHVARSLVLAEKQGYATPFNKERVINYLESGLSGLPKNINLRILQFLAEQGQTIKVKDLTDGIKKSKTALLSDKLIAERLLQLSGHQADWKWINSVRSETIKGNYYWGEDQHNLSDNSTLNTLTVYQIAARENPDSRDLIKIRNYFLEQRKKTWRNTYESSQILEAILPSLINKKRDTDKVKLQLSGSMTRTIDTFPFEYNTTTMEELTISKSGESPVYFTAYQESWNASPLRSDKDFVITTSFEDNTSNLIAGKPIRLYVKVEVKRDAEYVMIEVPVPAGCSYESKPQSGSNGEVHREYYNHKTNIFCSYLKKGIYNYTITLLPRYSGTYTLNPAVGECMYFPTLFGREEIKEVKIR